MSKFPIFKSTYIVIIDETHGVVNSIKHELLMSRVSEVTSFYANEDLMNQGYAVLPDGSVWILRKALLKEVDMYAITTENFKEFLKHKHVKAPKVSEFGIVPNVVNSVSGYNKSSRCRKFKVGDLVHYEDCDMADYAQVIRNANGANSYIVKTLGILEDGSSTLMAFSDELKHVTDFIALEMHRAIKAENDALKMQRKDEIKEMYNVLIHNSAMTAKDVSEYVVKIVDGVLDGEEIEDCGIKYQDWFDCMRDTLESNNVEFLGAGHFSMAVKVKGYEGKAVKVGFKKEDSGAAYAAYCRANPSEFLPDVLFTNRYSKVYTVVMPCYTTYDAYTGKDSVFEREDRLMMKTMYNASKEIIQYNEPLTLVSDYIAKTVNQTHVTMADIHAASRLGTDFNFLAKLDKFATTCKAIRKYFEGIASFDMHDENIMVNVETGNLIITDPVSWVQGE